MIYAPPNRPTTCLFGQAERVGVTPRVTRTQGER